MQTAQAIDQLSPTTKIIACENARKYAEMFRPGAIVGAYRVIEIRGTASAWALFEADVECTNCGAKHTISGKQLRNHHMKGCLRCKTCRNNNVRPVRVVRRDCTVCSDCPALRPANGSPCKCGGTRGEGKR